MPPVRPSRGAGKSSLHPPAASILRALVWPLLIACVTFVAFLPALANRLLEWDDQFTLTSNPGIRGLTVDHIRWMFTHYLMGHYQPLALLSFALDYQIWGMEAFGFHLTNLILHTVNAVLFYVLALRLLEWARPGKTISQGRRCGAAVAALLFAVHPLRVESVAWATERRDMLSALFYLLAVLAYLAAHRRRVEGKPAGGWMVAVLTAATLSLLTKVMAITLAPVLLVLDLYPLRRWRPGERNALKGLGRLLKEKLPLIVLSLIMAWIATQAQDKEGAWLGVQSRGLLVRIEGALFSLSFYLWKTLWPLRLSPLYEMPQTTSQINQALVLGGLIILLSGPIVWMRRREWGPFLSAWACYLILLAPTLGVFQLWPQIAADRYTYLACMGWAICAGGSVARWLEAKRPAWQAASATLPVAAWLASLALLTSRQTQVWHDEQALWKQAVEVMPSAIPLYNYGGQLIKAGRPAEAELCMRRALEWKPGDPRILANVGIALLGQGRDDEAMECFRTSLSIEENSYALSGMAYVWGRQGKLADAEHSIRRAIQLKPDDVESHEFLADALRRQHKNAEAIREYRDLVSKFPERFESRRRLADLLVETGNPGQAVQLLQEAVTAESGDALQWEALAKAYRAAGDATHAVDAAQQAVKLAESNPDSAQWLQRCRETLTRIKEDHSK